jgi:hypothetical protein
VLPDFELVNETVVPEVVSVPVSLLVFIIGTLVPTQLVPLSLMFGKSFIRLEQGAPLKQVFGASIDSVKVAVWATVNIEDVAVNVPLMSRVRPSLAPGHFPLKGSAPGGNVAQPAV